MASSARPVVGNRKQQKKRREMQQSHAIQNLPNRNLRKMRQKMRQSHAIKFPSRALSAIPEENSKELEKRNKTEARIVKIKKEQDLAFNTAYVDITQELVNFRRQLAADEAGAKLEKQPLVEVALKIRGLRTDFLVTDMADPQGNRLKRINSLESLCNQLEVDALARNRAQSQPTQPEEVTIPSAKPLYTWSGLTSSIGISGFALACFALFTLHPIGLITAGLLAGLAVSGALILGASFLLNRALRRAQVAGHLESLPPDKKAEFFLQNRKLRNNTSCLSSMTRAMRMLILKHKISLPEPEPKTEKDEPMQCSVLTKEGEKKPVPIYYRPYSCSLLFKKSDGTFVEANDSENVFETQFSGFCPK